MRTRIPAEVFPPGEFFREELETRGWKQADLAEFMGRPLRSINEIINGRKAITAETAIGLGEAFKTSAEYWMNLESAYRLHVARGPTRLMGNSKAALKINPIVKPLNRRLQVEMPAAQSVPKRKSPSKLSQNALTPKPRVGQKKASKQQRPRT